MVIVGLRVWKFASPLATPLAEAARVLELRLEPRSTPSFESLVEEVNTSEVMNSGEVLIYFPIYWYFLLMHIFWSMCDGQFCFFMESCQVNFMLGTSSAVAVVNGSEMLRNSKQHFFFPVSRACFAKVCSAVDFRSLAEVALPQL